MSRRTVSNFLKGKTVVIIGATGGIGEAFAKQCKLYTDKVILVGRNYDKIKKLSREIDVPLFFKLDITDYEMIDAVITEIEQLAGKIDILINLAGYDVFKNIKDISMEEVMATNRINFEAAIMLTQAILKMYVTRQKGIVANVNAFSNGLVSFPFYSIDSASRAGIACFYRSMRREISNLYPQIRFVTFSPPITDTAQERSRISSKVWDKLNMRYQKPEQIVEYILEKMAVGKNEIMSIDEKALQIVEKVSVMLSNLIFFNKFSKTVKSVLDYK
jgi:short-subunit dehydrogenase